VIYWSSKSVIRCQKWQKRKEETETCDKSRVRWEHQCLWSLKRNTHLHVAIPASLGRSDTFQVSSKSTEGFRGHAGRNLAIHILLLLTFPTAYTTLQDVITMLICHYSKQETATGHSVLGIKNDNTQQYIDI